MQLVIEPSSALLTNDTQTLWNMVCIKINIQDPYVIIQIGNLKKQTQVSSGGGVCPNWKEKIEFDNYLGEPIKVIVMDK